MFQDPYDNAAFDSDDDDWDSRGRRRTSSRRGEAGLARGRPRRTTAAGTRRGRYDADSGPESRGDENVLPQLSRMGYTSYGGAYKDEHLLRSLDEITTSNNPNAVIPGSKMTEAEFNNLPVEEQRKQRRLIRNRLSAHLHRQRQKAHIEALETQVVEMATIIEEYKARVQHMLRTTGNMNLPPVATKGIPADAQTPRPLFPHNLLTYQPPHIPGLLGFSNEVSANAGLIRAKTLHGILYPHNASTSLAPIFSHGGDLEISNGDMNAARAAITEMFANQDVMYYSQTTPHAQHHEMNSEENALTHYAAQQNDQDYQSRSTEHSVQNPSEYKQRDGHYYPTPQAAHMNQGLSLTIASPPQHQESGSPEKGPNGPDDVVKITIPHDASLTPKPLGETLSTRPIRDVRGYSRTYEPEIAEETVHAETTNLNPEVKPTIIPDFSYRTSSYSSVSGGGEGNVPAPFNADMEAQQDITPQSNESKDEADWKTASFGLDLLSNSATYYETGSLDIEPPKYERRKIEVDSGAPHRNPTSRPYHPNALPPLQPAHTFSDINPHLQRSSTVLSHSQSETELGTPMASTSVPKSFLPGQPALRRTATFANKGPGPLASQSSFSNPLATSPSPYS